MKRLLPLLMLLLLPLACNKPGVEDTSESSSGEMSSTYYVNLFAYNYMRAFYLWADEITSELSSWTYGDDPVKKVADCRYRNENKELVDKWTSLMEDYSSFESSVTGNGKTFGFDFYLTATGDHVRMVILYVYAGSPAQQAGLKRGDEANTFDGTELTRSNYSAILTEKLYTSPGTLQMGLLDGRTATMTAVQMYSNPVNVARTLEVGGKTFGYLHFTNFTLDSCEDLVEAFRQFKADGIEELVVDLRYNTGGYATTAAVLGSLIAPASVVSSKAVFNKDVYNSNLTPSMSADAETHFADSFTLTLSSGKKTLNTLEANPDIQRVWFIVTGQTASASESLICGLYPYMDVILVGTQTYGKFCGGYLFKGEDFFDRIAGEKTDIDCAAGKKATTGWGIYVIASRYADCNGVTRSMPSGIPVDIEALDNARDGHELGDPEESMLAAVLSLIRGEGPTRAASLRTSGPEEVPFHKPGDFVMLW